MDIDFQDSQTLERQLFSGKIIIYNYMYKRRECAQVKVIVMMHFNLSS